MKHAPIAIAPGVTYAAWTFGGTVPGPALHVRQGDTVDFTLVNGANIPHSMLSEICLGASRTLTRMSRFFRR